MLGTNWTFVDGGLLFVLPVFKYWMKETNMIVVLEDIGTDGPCSTRFGVTFRC
jgi:hypothetical protein